MEMIEAMVIMRKFIDNDSYNENANDNGSNNKDDCVMIIVMMSSLIRLLKL